MAWPNVKDNTVCAGTTGKTLLDDVMKKANTLAGADKKWHKVWGAAYICQLNKNHGKHKGKTDDQLLASVCAARTEIVKASPSFATCLRQIQHR
jgi:hypothetical protein